jgi:hypothetical protein
VIHCRAANREKELDPQRREHEWLGASEGDGGATNPTLASTNRAALILLPALADFDLSQEPYSDLHHPFHPPTRQM